MDKHGKTLVLSASYLPLSIIDTKRAFAIFYKGNAEIVENHPEMFKHPELEIYKPSVIRVYCNVFLNYAKVPLTRENIYKRDGYECVYCGNKDKKTFTLDHVIPQSKGGPTSWENLVTACLKCNNEKADLTIEEYGKPHPDARRPHALMLMKNTPNIPKEWKKYLLY